MQAREDDSWEKIIILMVGPGDVGLYGLRLRGHICSLFFPDVHLHVQMPIFGFINLYTYPSLGALMYVAYQSI